MEVQNTIAGHLEDENGCLMYSVDLSAAFDLLRKNTFREQLKDVMDPDLLSVIMDFLTDRQMVVEIDGKTSTSRAVRLGCVQGSVLGPKLFNIYMRNVTEHTLGHKLISYADDSYVILPGSRKQEVSACIKTHLAYLETQGMVTNLSKTEAVMFGNETTEETLEINGEKFVIGNKMKVLGVTFDLRMKFSDHVSNVVSKARKLSSALRMISKKLKYDQFLKVMTSQYYGKCFYGCTVWLNGSNSFLDVRRINALHYRALRIARNDFKRKLSRAELDRIGRARPTTWSNYLMASTAIKAITRGTPKAIAEELQKNMFKERRRQNRPKFFDDSKRKIGRQQLKNRLNFLNGLSFDWIDGMCDATLRINLKKEFGMTMDQTRLD